jgi:hypothetical protein
MGSAMGFRPLATLSEWGVGNVRLRRTFPKPHHHHLVRVNVRVLPHDDRGGAPDR